MSERKYRFPGNALQNVGPGSWQSHYEARIIGRDLNDSEILTDELFLNCRDILRAGDQVVICGYPSSAVDRLTQLATVRIVSLREKNKVKFKQIGKVVDIPYEVDEDQPEKPTEKAWPRRVFGGGYGVFDKDDNLLAEFKTNAEAKQAAERINAGSTL